MRFLLYLTIAILTVFSVLFEMNSLVEPQRKLANVVATQVGTPLASPNAPDAAAPNGSDAAVTLASPPPAPSAAAVASSKCDVTACAATYSSFRASDCTYQPDRGPRQLCDKGVISDRAAAEAALNAHPDANAPRAPAQCHVDACAQAYISFNPADCTYQPLEGPRRLCTK
jgi:hypothetical protein